MQKKIVRDYYEQLHTNKLELEEINSRNNLLRPKHEKVENLTRPITTKESESVIGNLLTNT